MRIGVVTAEMAPLAKVGGLGDVAGALSKQLAARGHEVTVCMPAYGNLRTEGLVEVARALGTQAWLVEDASDIDPGWLEGCRTVGLTAGASAPQVLVEQVIERLRTLGCEDLRAVEIVRENVRFNLPAELKRDLERSASG